MPIREVMLGLMRLLEFILSELEVLSIGSLTVLRVLVAGVFVVVVRELSTGSLTVLLDVFLVSMELPIREVMLGLMRLLVLVQSEVEVLLDGVFVPIELPMRDVMLELILLFELVADRFVIAFRVMLRLLMLLRLD